MKALRRQARKLKARARKLRRRLRETQRSRKRVNARIAEREEHMKLVDALQGEGVRYASLIIDEAERQDLPLADALALCHQEAGFQHIFGCDLGPREAVPWCRQGVTGERALALLAHVKRGGTSNGVSLTQLTSLDFLLDAEAEGGLHSVRACLRVGFDHQKYLLDKYGDWRAYGAYNGGEGNPIRHYADERAKLRDLWRRTLDEIRG